MGKITEKKSTIKQKYNRVFSEGFKKEKIKEIEKGVLSISTLCKLHSVSRTSVYKWIYLYSTVEKGVKTVIQMESEQHKTLYLQQRLAELERVIGQKQMEIDFLNKALEISSEELGYDLKKVRTATLEWFRKHQHGHQMKGLYALNGISKQGHFDALKRALAIESKEPCYVGLMMSIRELHPGMGLRKMYEQFQPEGIGRDAFVSLGLREGYRIKSLMDKPHRTTYSVKSNRFNNLLVGKWFTDVNQVWVSDIFYFPLNEKHYYVVLILDVYSRKLVGYSVADNMRAENNINALQMALTLRGIKHYKGNLIHHSDRGSQYVSDDYTNTLDAYGIATSMCKDVLENAHCERANGIIKNEYLGRWQIKSFEYLKVKVNDAVANYNNRKHNTIKMTPNNYEIALQNMAADKKPRMEIFTIEKSMENPLQMKMFNL